MGFQDQDMCSILSFLFTPIITSCLVRVSTANWASL